MLIAATLLYIIIVLTFALYQHKQSKSSNAYTSSEIGKSRYFLQSVLLQHRFEMELVLLFGFRLALAMDMHHYGLW
jgi:hypothetical protein